MTQRLFDVSYNREEGFIVKVKPNSFRLVPEPTAQHLRAANRELLLAMRSVLDQMIERTEATSGPKQPRKIEVKSAGAAKTS